MSIKWTNLRDGWVEEDNGGVPTWKANFPLKKAGTGSTKLNSVNQARTKGTTMVAVVNPATGSYDVSEADIFGRRNPIYSFNPETGASTPYSGKEAVYNKIFSGKGGEAQLRNLNTQIKRSTLQNLRNHTAGSSLPGATRTKLAKKYLGEIEDKGAYQSLANSEPEEKVDSEDKADPLRGDGESPSGGESDSTTALETADAEEVNKQLLNTTGGARKGTRNKFPDNLKYPIDLAQQTQDFLKIEMVKYVPRGFGPAEGGTTLGLNPDKPTGETIGRCFLPIASGIKDVNAVSFGSQNMDVIEAETAFAALGFINEGPEGMTNAVKSITSRITGNSAQVKDALTAFFAGEATGTGQQILQRSTGAVFNPNMELLFQGPSLRPFNFTYKMSARSSEEADMIIKIIRFFKQGMAPQRTSSNLFLKTPHTFKLEYVQNGATHKYLNKFKECALQSLSVEYAPEGTYATFSDGKMVSYQLSFTFQEIEPVFNDEYEEDGDTTIGF